MTNYGYKKDYLKKIINDEKTYIKALPSRDNNQDNSNSWRTTIYDVKLKYFVDRLIEANFFAGFDENSKWPCDNQ